MKAQLPVLLDVEQALWTKNTSPDESHDVWVSSTGKVRWAEAEAGDLLSFEDRPDGPQFLDDNRNTELEMATRRKLNGQVIAVQMENRTFANSIMDTLQRPLYANMTRAG